MLICSHRELTVNSYTYSYIYISKSSFLLLVNKIVHLPLPIIPPRVTPKFFSRPISGVYHPHLFVKSVSLTIRSYCTVHCYAYPNKLRIQKHQNQSFKWRYTTSPDHSYITEYHDRRTVLIVTSIRTTQNSTPIKEEASTDCL